ncbi:nuclear transport factor 2 family protein [Candidatus Aenigmatarchaeota archaeon]
MEPQQIKKVMRKYGKAWEMQDTKLLLECFTKNGKYQESPLTRPYCGHKEIEKFWNKNSQNTKNIKFKTKRCTISQDKKTGFVEWECKNIWKGKNHHMVGIMILKMKGNKISYLNEYWNSKTSK